MARLRPAASGISSLSLMGSIILETVPAKKREYPVRIDSRAAVHL